MDHKGREPLHRSCRYRLIHSPASDSTWGEPKQPGLFQSSNPAPPACPMRTTLQKLYRNKHRPTPCLHHTPQIYSGGLGSSCRLAPKRHFGGAQLLTLLCCLPFSMQTQSSVHYSPFYLYHHVSSGKLWRTLHATPYSKCLNSDPTKSRQKYTRVYYFLSLSLYSLAQSPALPPQGQL